MNTTEKISKSSVMTRAWNIYRSEWQYASSFAACLRRAWEVEKENIVYRRQQEESRRWEEDYKKLKPFLDTYFSVSAMMERDNYYERSGYHGD